MGLLYLLDFLIMCNLLNLKFSLIFGNHPRLTQTKKKVISYLLTLLGFIIWDSSILPCMASFSFTSLIWSSSTECFQINALKNVALQTQVSKCVLTLQNEVGLSLAPNWGMHLLAVQEGVKILRGPGYFSWIMLLPASWPGCSLLENFLDQYLLATTPFSKSCSLPFSL